MKKLGLPKHKIRALKSDLWGHIVKVAKEYNYPASNVSMVLNGTYYNQEIIDACIEYRDKLKEELNAQAEKI